MKIWNWCIWKYIQRFNFIRKCWRYEHKFRLVCLFHENLIKIFNSRFESLQRQVYNSGNLTVTVSKKTCEVVLFVCLPYKIRNFTPWFRKFGKNKSIKNSSFKWNYISLSNMNCSYQTKTNCFQVFVNWCFKAICGI